MPSAATPSGRWWDEMASFDAAFHVATRLESLLWGVENQETLEECQQAADAWMKDLREIAVEWKSGWYRWVK